MKKREPHKKWFIRIFEKRGPFVKRLILTPFLLFAVTSCFVFRPPQKNYYQKNPKEIAYQIQREKEEIPIKTNIAEKIIIGFDTPYCSLNPFFAVSSIDTFIRSATIGTLVYRIPSNGGYENSLAKEYHLSEDSQKISFILREGLKFSDGTPLTISDVSASFQFLNDKLRGTLAGLPYLPHENTLTIEATTDASIQLTLSHPDKEILYKLSIFPIMKKSELERITDYHSFFENTRLTFAGAYVIEELQTNRLLLKANPFYHRQDSLGNHYPYTNYLELFTTKDRETLIRNFLNGEIDLFEAEPGEYKMLSPLMRSFNRKKRVVNAGYQHKRIITAYNCYQEDSAEYMKDKQVRSYLASLLGKLTEKGKISIEPVKNIVSSEAYQPPKIKKHIFTETDGKLSYNEKPMKLRIILFGENQTHFQILKNNIQTLFDDAFFNHEIRVTEDLSEFLDIVFYQKNYDIALFEYQTAPNKEALKTLLSNETSSFSPFIINGEKKNISSLNEFEHTFDSNKLEIKGELLAKEIQFFPTFGIKNYFFLDYSIYNFFYHPNFSYFCDTVTIEMLFKEKKQN